MVEIYDIRDLDIASAGAKKYFRDDALPKILEKHCDVDREKLTKLALDFFDVFCDLNQVKLNANRYSSESGLKYIRSLELASDTTTQWQYYAAFFYHRLSHDSDIDAAYKPKELEELELRMSCPASETLGLGHDKAVSILGSLIRAGMNIIRIHFHNVAIHTTNVIPEANEGHPEKLLPNEPIVWPESYPSRLTEAQPSAQAHVPSQSERALSA